MSQKRNVSVQHIHHPFLHGSGMRIRLGYHTKPSASAIWIPIQIPYLSDTLRALVAYLRFECQIGPRGDLKTSFRTLKFALLWKLVWAVATPTYGKGDFVPSCELALAVLFF